MRKPLWAITIRQPWAICISHGRKRIENRRWAPPDKIVGGYLGIHAGQTYDDDPRTDHFVWDVMQMPLWDRAQMARGALVAVARLAEVVTESDDPWFTGPYGWVLADVVPLQPPVDCAGRRGVWQVPADLMSAIRAAYTAARQQQDDDEDAYWRMKRDGLL